MSLAENYVISNQLKKVQGRKIVKVVANQNPHSFVWFALGPEDAYCDPETSWKNAALYEELLADRVISDSDVNFGAYGVYNFLYVGDRALIFNIPVKYLEKGMPLPKRHQLLLTLDDGASIAFCGSLGGPIFLFKVDGDKLAIGYKPKEFPSVLSDNFTFEYFMDVLSSTKLKSMSVKEFLATKNRFPGLDNYILHELLWKAGVNPKSKMTALTTSDFRSIHAAIKKVFPAVISAGGLDTQKDLFGHFGGYKTKASKNTLGRPCERCGELIVKETYLGGSIYYCPGCQNIKK